MSGVRAGALAVFLLTSTACISSDPWPDQNDWKLQLVEPRVGETTRIELIAQFGDPTYSFDGARILVWRLVAISGEGDLTQREARALSYVSGDELARAQQMEALWASGRWLTVDGATLDTLPRRARTRWLEVSFVAVLDESGKVSRWSAEQVLP